MRLVTDNGLYRSITVQDYEPTPAEMHYYYSGTHAGPDPNNPYAPKHAVRVTRTTYRKVSD